MNIESFRELALRVLSNEATPEERSQVESLVSSDADMKSEYKSLQDIRTTLQSHLNFFEASHESTPPFPQHRIRELDSRLDARFPIQPQQESNGLLRWFTRPKTWATSLSLALALVVVVLSLPGGEESFEYGYIKTEGTRSLAISDLPKNEGVKIKAFASARDFQDWIKTPLDKKSKGKAWVDFMANEVIIFRRDSNGETQIQKLPLPENATQAEILDVIQGSINPK